MSDETSLGKGVSVFWDSTNRVEHKTCLLGCVSLLAIVEPPFDGVSCGWVVTLVWLPSDMHEPLSDSLVLDVVCEEFAGFLSHPEEGVLILLYLGFEVCQTRFIVREDSREIGLLTLNLPFLLLNYRNVSVMRGEIMSRGRVVSYKCPNWVFWPPLSTEALYPVGPVFDQKWFAIWSLAKVGMVNSSADFTLVFHNQEVRDGLIGQGLLEMRETPVNPLGRTELLLVKDRSWRLTAVVIPAMPAPLRSHV